VIGISRDDSATSRRFREQLQLPFDLVSDSEGTIAKAYGVLWPVIGLARRVSFVLEKGGRVKSVYSSEWAPESHAAHACEVLVAGTGP
jgi:peroxiredoxin Q/BCP